MNRIQFLAAVVSVLLPIVGCRGTPSVPGPKFNSGKIAANAMELCDRDGDGYLTKNELAQFPGLLDGMRTIDRDGDAKLTADEIATRMEELIKSKNACQIVVCQVTRGKKPVTDAVITFEPEPFLSDVIVRAEGTTDAAGHAELTCSATPLGAQPGFYRVSISKLDGSRETIPEQFNTSTTLGAEVSGLSLGNETGCYFFSLD